MPRISLQDVEKYSKSDNNVDFFTLKNDGDKAIVRIFHDSLSDVELLPTHEIKVSDKTRKIVCIREPEGDKSDCPLCEKGLATSVKMYLNLLVYEPDEDGYYTKAPKLAVFERGQSFIRKIQSLENRYCARGKKLIDTVFEIERQGAYKDPKTTFDFQPVLDLDADECPIPEELEKFIAEGGLVISKDYDDILHYLDKGSFPEKEADNAEKVERRPSRNSVESAEEIVRRNNSNTDSTEGEAPTPRRRRPI